MRFDDRLETTLRQADDSDRSLSAKWQQLVDILAQSPRDFDQEFVATGLLKVRQFMPLVPVNTREACVRALSGGIQSAPLVMLLSGDVPPVASAAIAGARLDDDQWADIIPHLSVRARGFLRNRNDLGPLTRRALAVWSSADFVLPIPDNVQAAGRLATESGVQIRDIVERIERLEEEKAALAGDIKDVYLEAKGTGFDVKVLRQVIRLRKQNINERKEMEAVLETYLAALGMLDDAAAGLQEAAE